MDENMKNTEQAESDIPVEENFTTWFGGYCRCGQNLGRQAMAGGFGRGGGRGKGLGAGKGFRGIRKIEETEAAGFGNSGVGRMGRGRRRGRGNGFGGGR